MNEFVQIQKPPSSITKLGFFGSYAIQKNEITNDIDILVFEDIDLNKEDDVIKSIKHSITKDEKVDINILNTCSEDANAYLTKLADYLKLPFRIALGPVLNEPDTQYLHINASFNESLWRKFNDNLPIHAHLISGNYISILGERPYLNELIKNDFHKYINLMDRRFSNFKITNSYLRKIVKSLALLNGFNSADYAKCLSYLTDNGIISKELATSIIDTTIESEFTKFYNILKPIFYA